MISIRNLSKIFSTPKGKVQVLKNVNLKIKKGDIFGIIGFSGAGKSTMIRCLNRIEEPTSGSIFIGNNDITAMNKVELREARKKIGMIFQDFNLFDSMNVYKNVAFPLKIAGFSEKDIKGRVHEILSLVKLKDKIDFYPAQLSGGEKQRVGIARALANEPDVLLSDEATSSLDPQTTYSILELLRDINKKLNLTIVLITHELDVVKYVCNMKRKSIIFLVLALVIGVFSGCSSGSDSQSADSKNSNKTVVKIGAAAVPHAEILNHIKPELAKEGIDLEVVVLDNEDELNPALKEKQIDANYFQHVPYLESVAKEKGYNFAVAGKVHVEPIGFYSDKIKSKDELKNGAEIAIPNNPSNEYRALALLQAQGLIKLKSGIANYSATPSDIIDNPKNLKFVEVDAAQLPRVLQDVEGSIINTNLVLEAKLDPNKALFREDNNSPYANVIVVRKGDENKKEIKTIVTKLNSEDVKNFIKKKYGVAVVPAF